jgi:SAM-dependent methyltransferase
VRRVVNEHNAQVEDASTAALAAEYSQKAEAYARLWSPVIKPMAAPLIDALPLASARRILDAGSGTGAFLPDFRRAAPAATVIAVDRADGMLRARSLPEVPAAVMDVQVLGLASDAFDVAALIFSVFHLPDPLKGLVELRRVVKPGGALGIATWGMDPGQPGMAFWTRELDRAGAPPDPRDPSVNQRDLMNTPDRLRRLVSNAGFRSVRIWSTLCAHRWTVDRLMSNQTSCGAPMRRLEQLPPDVRIACEANVRRDLETLTEDELIYRPEVLFCVAG